MKTSCPNQNEITVKHIETKKNNNEIIFTRKDKDKTVTAIHSQMNINYSKPNRFFISL